MYYTSFGELLKTKRLEKQLTQTELATCFSHTKKFIWKLENNLQLPSIDQLIEIENFFNFDFYSYIKTEYSGLSMATYKIVNDIKLAISENNNEYYKLYKKYKDDEQFLSGYPLETMYLCAAIYEYRTIKDYNNALKIAISGVKINVPNFDYNNITPNSLFDISYLLINLIGILLIHCKMESESIKVFKQLSDNLEQNFDFVLDKNENINFYILSIYITVTNNIAQHYLDIGNYANAITYSEKAITSCVFNKYMKQIGYIYLIQFESYYKIADYHSAKKSVLSAFVHFNSVKKYNKIDELNEKIKAEFPELIDCLWESNK